MIPARRRAVQIVTLSVIALTSCGSPRQPTPPFDASVQPLEGNVLVAQSDFRGTRPAPTNYALQASFAATSRPADGCTVLAYAACEVRRCPETGGDGGTSGSPPNTVPNAGTLTLSGGTLGAPVSVRPASSGYYATAVTEGRAWNGGELIELHAEGSPGGVPTFRAVLAGPSTDAVLTAPMLDSTTLLVVDRSRPLRVTWRVERPPTSGELIVRLATSTLAGGSLRVEMECRFDLATGSGTVPAEALGHIPPSIGSVAARVEERVRLNASTWTVSVVLTASASAPTGAAAGSVQYQ